MMDFENKEEADALNKVLKGRKINVLMGVGAGSHVQHCFELGFPDTMVLIDPAWDKENYEIPRLEKFKDRDIPLKFIQTSSTVDIVEFSFGGQKKTVHFYKVGYNPSILGSFTPDVFHMGHAVIGSHPGYLPFEPVLESMLLLPKGTIIMNTDGGCTPYCMSLKIYANYFLAVAAAYQVNDVWTGLGTYYIYKKTRDIDERENILVYKFARAFDEFCDCLEGRQSMKELEARVNELRSQGKIISEEDRSIKSWRQHQKDILGLPKTLETIWGVFNTTQKKRLIKLIREFAGENKKELVEEAMEILNLE